MPPPRPNVATITLWHSWSEFERQTLDDVLNAFQQVYPDIYFDVLYVPLDQLRSQYEIAAYSGAGPDLLFGPAEWGPVFYDQELVADLSGIATGQFLATILPAALDQARYKQALIGLPLTIQSGVVLYRNQSIISSPPATYADLVSSAKAATRPGQVGAYLERSYYFSAAHLYGTGGRLMDDSGNPFFNTVQGREWLNLLVSFRDAGPVDFYTNRDLDYFSTGRAGFIIDSTANLRMLSQALGDKLVIDPWPTYKNGHLSGFIRTENVYLNGNLNPDQRYNPLLFMGFLLSPEVQQVLTRADRIPVVPAAQIDDPLLRQAVEAFKKATAYPIHPGTAVYWEPLETALFSVFTQQVPVQTALQRAHDMVTAGLAESRRR
jgi:maltose-binding protein MalE